MKIVEINVASTGSTGTIMLQVAEAARKRGHSAYTFSRKWRGNQTRITGHEYFGSFLENAFHQVTANLTGYSEFGSFFGTLKLLGRLNRIRPDVIHLHNLHGWYIHLPLLFRYIRRHHIPVVWTLHDCWGFTGHCPHFQIAKCSKWREGCYSCPQFRLYPATCVDRSAFMWKMKKKWFTNLDRLTIVTPSHWLAQLAEKSFLQHSRITVIRNGINLSIFRPRESSFRTRYQCENKFILLGVASNWGIRKGLDIFIDIAKRLGEDYRIVLVGMRSDMAQDLPANIISISETQDQIELAEIYSSADVFLNPTREDTFPTVNIEALACGIPVITFNTGGGPEIIDDSCGKIVSVDETDALVEEILRIHETHPYSKQDCVLKASQFERDALYERYVQLFEEIIENENDFPF